MAGLYVEKHTGRQTAVWPTPASKEIEQVIFLDRWEPFESCGRAFAKAFIVVWGNASPRTRHSVHGQLVTGWFAFLSETDRSDFQLEDLSYALIEAFIGWLNGAKDDVARWHVNSRRKLYGSARAIINYLHVNNESGLSQFFMREAPWPAAHHETVPRNILSRPQLLALIQAANADVETFCDRRDKALSCMQSQRHRAQQLFEGAKYERGEYASLGLVLGLLDLRYPGILPPFDVIRRDDKALSRSISRDHGGLREIEPFFYPTMEALIPFFILQLYHWAANTETLLGLPRSDVSVDDVLGGDRVRCRPKKEKAGGTRIPRSYPLTNDVTNPGTMFRYLDKWPTRVRPLTHPVDRDMYWLVVSRVDPRNRGKPLRPVAITVTKQKATLDAARRAFCKKHNLIDFKFYQLKKTKLDVTDELFEGDVLAVAAEAGHTNVNTTANSYRSPGATARDHQSIAVIQATRDRHSLTGGRVDSRDRGAQEDRHCATPGFTCADPFDSPWDFIPKGQLCTAYCYCPICPLASTDTRSPYVLGRLLQLRNSLIAWAEELDISPERWRTIYSRCVDTLYNKWLPLFVDPDVIGAASRLDLTALPRPE